MKRILIAFCLFTSMGTFAQSKTINHRIADETWDAETNTSYKILTDNEAIAHKVIERFWDDMKGYSCRLKKDRQGKYGEYTITFPIALQGKVVPFIQSLPKASKK